MVKESSPLFGIQVLLKKRFILLFKTIHTLYAQFTFLPSILCLNNI